MLPVSRSEAIQVGSPVYFTGKACKRGHVAQRETVYGVCVKCREFLNRQDRDVASGAVKRA